MSAGHIYRNFTEGRGGEGIASAAAIVKKLVTEYEQQADEIMQLTREMESAWQGEAASAAQWGAEPLADAHRQAAPEIDVAQDLSMRQVGSFGEAKHSVRPLPPEPTFPDPWMMVTSPDAGATYKDQVAAYNAAVQHNVDVMSAYDGASVYNTTRLPSSYGLLLSDTDSTGVVAEDGGAGAGNSGSGSSSGGLRPGGGSPRNPGPGKGVPPPGSGQGGRPFGPGQPHGPGQQNGPGQGQPGGRAEPGDLGQPSGTGQPSGSGHASGSGQSSSPGHPLGPDQGTSPGSFRSPSSPDSTPTGGPGSLPQPPGSPGGMPTGAPGNALPQPPGGIPTQSPGALPPQSPGSLRPAAPGSFGGPTGVPVMGAARGQGGEDGDHERLSFLQEADPEAIFGAGERTAPPVIE